MVQTRVQTVSFRPVQCFFCVPQLLPGGCSIKQDVAFTAAAINRTSATMSAPARLQNTTEAQAGEKIARAGTMLPPGCTKFLGEQPPNTKP